VTGVELLSFLVLVRAPNDDDNDDENSDSDCESEDDDWALFSLLLKML